jgi:predicted enzyme related to lactoylglutathione lyase
MARITGIGGIFFKCKDRDALGSWYRDVLGIAVEDWGGALFRPSPEEASLLVWSPFAADSTYFAPSAAPFMINFAVDDLDGMMARLTEKGVAIIARDDSDANGRFAWILDPEGTKLELWEPKK